MEDKSGHNRAMEIEDAVGRRLEDRERMIDRQVALWRTIAVAAIGIVITLLGAWATHSVTREDVATSIFNQNTQTNLMFSTLTARIDATTKNLDRLEALVERIQSQLTDQGTVTYKKLR